MALLSGADLVLELPLTWAISSAQEFARGGVAVLCAAGVTDLFCGSESGSPALISRAAQALRHPDYPSLLRAHLASGVSFAAARQSAVQALAGREAGEVLSRPNDLLAVSYQEALQGSGLVLHPVLRTGAAHNAPEAEDGFASASAIRSMLCAGEVESACACMPSPAGALLRSAWDSGVRPASLSHCERAMLYRLRQMTPSDFALLPDCSEGLEHRLYAAARQAESLGDFLRAAQSRRYPLARIRRLALWAFLGLTSSCRRPAPLYHRLLAMNGRGRALVRQMVRQQGQVVISAPGGAKALTGAGAAYLRLEERAADLWQLCLPRPGACGAIWRANPVIMP
jgi:predicted nucleotidyltransferase